MILQANLGQNSNVLEMKSKQPLNHLRLDNFKRLNIIETLFIINYFKINLMIAMTIKILTIIFELIYLIYITKSILLTIISYLNY